MFQKKPHGLLNLFDESADKSYVGLRGSQSSTGAATRHTTEGRGLILIHSRELSQCYIKCTVRKAFKESMRDRLSM